MLTHPGNASTTTVPVTICCSEHEAWDYLNTSQDPNAVTPEYLYRGQSQRWIRLWPPEDRGGIRRHQFETDSIVPTDYRGLEAAVGAATATTKPLFSNQAALLRSILTWGAIVEHGESLSPAASSIVLGWLNTQAALPHTFDAVGSVGQHYGLMTGYTDATSSLAVAFWFASRKFFTGEYCMGGLSVIYKWRLSSLHTALARANSTNGWRGRDSARVVDIRGIPTEIGLRPQQQSGWSLINTELISVLIEAIKDAAIEAVVFPRTGPCPDNNLPASVICPSGENIDRIFRDVLSGAFASPVRQRVLDEWVRNNPGQLPSIDLHDSRYRGWVIN